MGLFNRGTDRPERGHKAARQRTRPAGCGKLGAVVQRTYRLGLFDPDPEREGVFYDGPVYGDTQTDKARMRLAVENYASLAATNPRIRLCMGIFAMSPPQSPPGVRDGNADIEFQSG